MHLSGLFFNHGRAEITSHHQSALVIPPLELTAGSFLHPDYKSVHLLFCLFFSFCICCPNIQGCNKVLSFFLSIGKFYFPDWTLVAFLKLRKRAKGSLLFI